VLGTCLAEGSSWFNRVEHLVEGATEVAELFFDPNHYLVATAMQTVVKNRGALSVASVTDQILSDPTGSSDRLVPDVQTYLVNMQSRASIRGLEELSEAVNTLNNKLQLRNQIRGAESLISRIFDEQPHPNEVAGEMRELSMNAAVSDDTPSFGEVITEMEARDGMGVTHRISTGIHELDGYFRGGLEPQRMYVIGARPKVGKTTLMLNMILEALAQDSVVIFASLEIGERELWSKLVSAQSMVEQRRIQDMLDAKIGMDDFDPEERESIREAMAGLKSCDLYTMFAGNLMHGVDSVISRTMRLMQKHKGRPIVIFIDYLQLLSSDTFNKAAEIGSIGRKLKLFSIEMNCTVVAASQINRAGAEEGMPSPHNLRDSGSIEQDADVVALLNRPALQDETQPEHIMDCWVALNRYGPSGYAKMAYMPQIQTIQNLDSDEDDYDERRSERGGGRSSFDDDDDDEGFDRVPSRRSRDDDDEDEAPRGKKDKKRKRRRASDAASDDYDEPGGRRSRAYDDVDDDDR